MESSGKLGNVIAGAMFGVGVFLIEVLLFDKFWKRFQDFSLETFATINWAGVPGLLSFAVLCIVGFMLSAKTIIKGRYLLFGMGLGFLVTIIYNIALKV